MMHENTFRKVVMYTVNKLTVYGYQLHQEPAPYTVEFVKPVVEGVTCFIRFQLIHVPKVSKFQVILIRRNSNNSVIETDLYEPLFIDLPNLMFGLYRQNITPANMYAWEFEDESSLQHQINHAASSLFEYGLRWLNDPHSNMSWIKGKADQTKN
jgi:hypothetical protein